MSNVASAFGHSTPRNVESHPKIAFDTHVGIELEIEECHHIELPFWDCKEDGSLRNGCELVCAEPYSGATLFSAIEVLAEGVSKSSAQGTWRCSTHVHVDVRDLDAPSLKRMILAYAFYEKMLFKCSGFHRYRSNFCPAFAVVQQQIFHVSNAFSRSGERFFNGLVSGWDKYTSLNLLPLREFGSVEFRISEPKWKRSNVLSLVNRYLVLKKLAVENSSMSPAEFLNHLRRVGFEPMLEHLPFDYHPNEDDLNCGWMVANDILATRAPNIAIVPRVVDFVDGVDGTPSIPLEALNHWDSYIRYVYNNAGRWARINLAEFLGAGADDWRQVTHLTEAQLREIIDRLRNATRQDGREFDGNIRHTVPDGLESDLNQWVSSN